MKVIIGAGPAGLYAAIKLRKAGIKDVVIYDPRAGEYTRPGHLNENAFRKAEDGIGKKFWQGRFGHIKDFERALYEEALKLGIKIEKKRFVGLREDSKNPGVIVNDGTNDEFVPADYVFDCTGSRRDVIKEVNALCPESPLKLKDVTDVPVKNHFLAYVKLSEDQLDRINEAHELEPLRTLDSLSFARSIVKLRELGWKEFTTPRCYGVYFGKGKSCLYLQTPDNLAKTDHDRWVQTVLECHITPVGYQHLPPSKKYSHKPRFVAFPVSAQALEQVSYKGKNLPEVIALGDAQIDPNYYLAHGIRNGMSRIDALFDTMEIFDGKIYYFNEGDYLAEIQNLLREHKQQVIEEANEQRKAFADALELARLHFKQALILTSDVSEKSTFTKILTEIEARQSYAKGSKLFAECHSANKVKLAIYSVDTLVAKLNLIHIDLLKAYSDLPASFGVERKDAKDLLLHLATSWKDVGNELYKKGRLQDAIEAYKKAIDIYNLPTIQGTQSLQELPIHSNLVIAYSNAKMYNEAIVTAQMALDVYQQYTGADRPAALYEKLVFNLIKTLCAQGEEFLATSKNDKASSCHQQAQLLMKTHKEALSEKIALQINQKINELQKRIPKNSEALTALGVFTLGKTEGVSTPTKEFNFN
ncbi:Pyridine nucleotide-disulphide oxidoreductase [Legionella lansingensis]|uniref:Pyridine nucleotide-disulfide oxidoreductase n=1 Tax=Legionella lansingensis TaxID=45067 RepID=A0A0W0VU80_9GAMM|nr:NAD(P)-binding protein [Legionella lansingensis]KTD23776.1 Pyridine nucleotide-disulfide oxidoreductase [Legionella lansingensis]SNV47365.1 Pyridine nucleotide-disulphide oxidoreductase [Legionella lansingensis]